MKFMNRHRFRLRKRDAAVVLREGGGQELYIPNLDDDGHSETAMGCLMFALLFADNAEAARLRAELLAMVEEHVEGTP